MLFVKIRSASFFYTGNVRRHALWEPGWCISGESEIFIMDTQMIRYLTQEELKQLLLEAIHFALSFMVKNATN